MKSISRNEDTYIVAHSNDIRRFERFVMAIFKHLADMDPAVKNSERDVIDIMKREFTFHLGQGQLFAQKRRIP